MTCILLPAMEQSRHKQYRVNRVSFPQGLKLLSTEINQIYFYLDNRKMSDLKLKQLQLKTKLKANSN